MENDSPVAAARVGGRATATCAAFELVVDGFELLHLLELHSYGVHSIG